MTSVSARHHWSRSCRRQVYMKCVNTGRGVWQQKIISTMIACQVCQDEILWFFLYSWFFWTLPVLLQRWFSICLVCVHTDAKGKQRKARVGNIFKNFRKNTIFNEHPVDKFEYLSFKGDLVNCHFWHVGEPFLLMFHNVLFTKTEWNWVE